MTNFVFAPIFGAFANFALALFIFFRAPRLRLNQVYLGWGLAVTLWCVGASVLFYVQNAQYALQWARVLHLGVIWIPALGLHVCLLMSRVSMPQMLFGSYAIAVVLSLGNLIGAHISGISRVPYGWFAKAGPGFWAFSIFMPIATLPAIYALIHRRIASEPEHRRKFTILIVANSLLMITGSHDLLPVLGWSQYPGTKLTVYPWGTYAAGFYGLLVAYAVLHDQILDVRVTLSRYVAYFVRLAFFFSFALLLLVVVAAFAPEDSFTRFAFVACLAVSLTTAIVTAVIFPKLFGGVSEGLERKLLGDKFEYQEQIQALADSVHRHTTLESMWHEVGTMLRDAMGVAPVHCLLLGARKFAISFRSSIPSDHASSAVLDALSADCALLSFFGAGERVLDVHVASRNGVAQNAAAAQECSNLGAEYVFALRGAERVLGFLAVGPKRNRTPFTRLDIELLVSLAQRVAWATERTLLASQIGFAERHELLALMSRGMAHDLNNLLTPVSTFIQITGAQYSRRSPEGQVLSAAETSIRTIRDYVEEAIFFAKDLKPRMTPIDIPELLSEVKSICSARATRRSVEIVCEAEPGSLTADGVLCQRMLANLVSNAIDASAPNQVVRIVTRFEHARGVVRFRVVDQGKGIPPELREQVFQPYFTTKDSGGDGERGFGLGLSICQLIVELHQGVISLTSAVGKGTTVTVELPREGAGDPPWIPKHQPL